LSPTKQFARQQPRSDSIQPVEPTQRSLFAK
jgi:hypothetical protein